MAVAWIATCDFCFRTCSCAVRGDFAHGRFSCPGCLAAASRGDRPRPRYAHLVFLLLAALAASAVVLGAL